MYLRCFSFFLPFAFFTPLPPFIICSPSSSPISVLILSLRCLRACSSVIDLFRFDGCNFHWSPLRLVGAADWVAGIVELWTGWRKGQRWMIDKKDCDWWSNRGVTCSLAIIRRMIKKHDKTDSPQAQTTKHCFVIWPLLSLTLPPCPVPMWWRIIIICSLVVSNY